MTTAVDLLKAEPGLLALDVAIGEELLVSRVVAGEGPVIMPRGSTVGDGDRVGGAIALEFWLAIDKHEQAERFKAREETGYKRHKITDEDWCNREKRDEYAAAVCDMTDRTSTSNAPWTLVEANDKYYARVKVLKTICKRLENSL